MSPSCEYQHVRKKNSYALIPNRSFSILGFSHLPEFWGLRSLLESNVYHVGVTTLWRVVRPSFSCLLVRHGWFICGGISDDVDLCETCFYATHYSLGLYRLFDSCFGKGFYGFIVRLTSIVMQRRHDTAWQNELRKFLTNCSKNCFKQFCEQFIFTHPLICQSKYKLCLNVSDFYESVLTNCSKNCLKQFSEQFIFNIPLDLPVKV